MAPNDTWSKVQADGGFRRICDPDDEHDDGPFIAGFEPLPITAKPSRS